MTRQDDAKMAREKNIDFLPDLPSLPHQSHRMVATHFPLGEPKPKADWITDSTWNLMRMRGYYRRVHELARAQARRRLVRYVFRCWAGTIINLPVLNTLVVVGHCECNMTAREIETDISQACALAYLFATSRIVTRMVRNDRNANAERVAVKAQAAKAAGDSRELYICAKSLAPLARKPPLTVLLEDGSLAQTPQEVFLRWRQHFAAKLRAAVVTFDALLIESLANQVGSLDRMHACGVDWSVVPSVYDVARLLAKGKAHKAAGEDGLPHELFAIAPMQFAAIFHPLWLKSALRIQEPLAWKGGMFANLYKGSGRPEDTANSRGI